MSQEQDGISLQVPCFACPGRESLGRESTSGGGCGDAGIPAAGTLWQDSVLGGGGHNPTAEACPMEGGGLLFTGKSCKNRPVTVAYVVNGEASQQNNAESMALQCLKDACDTVGSKLETVNFGKLDFGETTVLDSFYNAGELSERSLLKSLQMHTKLLLSSDDWQDVIIFCQSVNKLEILILNAACFVSNPLNAFHRV